MNKRMITLCLALMTMLLSGCQLAVDTENESGRYNPDHIVGVVVTTEHLDLFDMEGYLEDNLGAIMNGKNPDESAYQGRIYAQEVVEESVGENGMTYYTTYYNFDHVDGLELLFYTTHTYREDGELLAEITTNGMDESGLWDVCFGTELTEGTVYFPDDAAMMLYVNPVYQDGEGKLYLVQGDSMHADLGTGSMSLFYTEEITENIDGEKVTQKREFKITAKGVTISDRVVLVQMDKNHQIILRQEYAPEALPEELIPEEHCAYIILEKHAGDEITREMLQREDEWISVQIMGDKPYCLGQSVTIRWQ